MSDYRQPWWLFLSKTDRLVTSIQEESSYARRAFTIQGEPVVQSIAWLIWGPIIVLAVIALLTGLVIILDISTQGGLVKALCIAGFVALPALIWGAVIVGTNRLSARHIQLIKQRQRQESVIELDQVRGTLTYSGPTTAARETIAFQHIKRADVTAALGARDGKLTRLTLETDTGPVLLLSEALGSQAQKIDLAQEIQQSLDSYAENQKTPPAQ